MPRRRTVRRRAIRRKTRRGGSYYGESPGAYEERAYSNIVRQIDTATTPDAKVQGMTKIMEFLAKSRTLLHNQHTRQQLMFAISTYNHYYMQHEASLSDKVVEDFQEAYNELHNRIEDMNAENRRPPSVASLNSVRRQLRF